MFRKYGDPLGRTSAKGLNVEETFNFYGWTVTESGCWEYNGSRNVQNYGRLTQGGKHLKASRAAYELWVGAIPDGMIIRHTCDNPPCINPAHLIPGTYGDNSRDMFERGRQNDVRGEKHGRAKLTDAIVREIKTRAVAGELQKTIALDLGINFRTVSSIVNGHSWKHVKIGVDAS